MVRIFVFLAACACAGTAAAQLREFKPPEFKFTPPPPRVDFIPRVLEATRPDTTLLDDTRAAGLQSRPAPQPQEGRGDLQNETPLPFGKHCLVETVRGNNYAGVLESAGRWIVLRRDDGRRVWIAARRVVAILETPATDENGARAEPQGP